VDNIEVVVKKPGRKLSATVTNGLRSSSTLVKMERLTTPAVPSARIKVINRRYPSGLPPALVPKAKRA
jgi:hypothetical protein